MGRRYAVAAAVALAVVGALEPVASVLADSTGDYYSTDYVDHLRFDAAYDWTWRLSKWGAGISSNANGNWWFACQNTTPYQCPATAMWSPGTVDGLNANTWIDYGPYDGQCFYASQCFGVDDALQVDSTGFYSGTALFDAVTVPDARDFMWKYDQYDEGNKFNPETSPTPGLFRCVTVATQSPQTIMTTATQLHNISGLGYLLWPQHMAVYAATWDGMKTVDFGVWDGDSLGEHWKVPVSANLSGEPHQVCMAWLPMVGQGGTTAYKFQTWLDGSPRCWSSTGAQGCTLTSCTCNFTASPAGSGPDGWSNMGGALPNATGTCAGTLLSPHTTGLGCGAEYLDSIIGGAAEAADALTDCTHDTSVSWQSSPGGTGSPQSWYCNHDYYSSPDGTAHATDVAAELWRGFSGDYPGTGAAPGASIPGVPVNWTCYPAPGTPGDAIAMSGPAGTQPSCSPGYQLAPYSGWVAPPNGSGTTASCTSSSGSSGWSGFMWPAPLSHECKWIMPQPVCTSPDGILGWVTGSVPYGLCLVTSGITWVLDAAIDVIEPGGSATATLASIWNDNVSQHIPFSLFGPAYNAVVSALNSPAKDWCFDTNPLASAVIQHTSTGTTSPAPSSSANTHACASTIVTPLAQSSPVGPSYRTIISGIWAVAFCVMWIKFGIGKEASGQGPFGRLLDFFDGSEGGA